MQNVNAVSVRAAALLWFLLEITLVFAFFAPTLWHFHKTIFIYDIILGLWPLLLILNFHPKKIWNTCPKKLWIYSLSFLFTLSLVFFHGRYRMNLLSALNMVHIWPTSANEAFALFSWSQDGPTYLRFLTWSLAAISALVLVYLSGDHAKTLHSKFAKLWGYLAVIEAFVGLLSFFGPPQIRVLVYGLSGYSPPPWIPRLTGTLTSPMELAAFLAPALLWWAFEMKNKLSLKNIISFLLIFLALFFTKCISVIIGLLIALNFVFIKPQNIIKHYKKAIAFMVPALGLLAFILHRTGDWALKWRDMQTRLGPWRVYLKATTSRFDYILLGLGFARTHTDNSYIHLFRTGGIVLSGFYLWFIFRVLKMAYKISNLSLYARWLFACGVIFLISGLTLDIFIYRSIATCLIFASVLLLVDKKSAG